VIINVDFESRSLLDLRKVGLYPYAAHPSTVILCAAYAANDGPVHLWMRGDPAPALLIRALLEGAEWHAWNAQFERVMWRDCWARPGEPMHAFGAPALEEWHCSMARGGIYGLPLGLAQAAYALKIPETKDMGGRALMLRMCRPRSFNADGSPVWWEEREKMDELGRYCANDVKVERAIAKRLNPLSDVERRVYLLDQTINDRGVLLDVELAKASKDCAILAALRADVELDNITSGAVRATNRLADLKRWVCAQGVKVETLAIGAIEEMLHGKLPQPVAEALAIRADAAKSSVAKLDSMLEYAQLDGRLRGLHQYCGAATGRWSGRGVQPQNFPRGTIRDVERLIPLVMEQDLDMIDAYAPVMEVLSSLLRAHLCAEEGFSLMAGDYAAIEARVLAWLAGQEDLLALFRTGGDPYVAMAGKVYHTTKVSKDQRAFGKVAVLGLGYQMGRKTFRDNCAKRGIDITEEFAAETVQIYRETNDRIKALWDAMDANAIRAVRSPGYRTHCGRITFIMRHGWLEMILPGGRSLYYAEPQLIMTQTPWGEDRECVSCMNNSTMTKQWTPKKMYGGLWVENAVQAVARDVLAEAMLKLESAGFPLVLTVHDEIVAEVPGGAGSRLAEFKAIMSEVPEWAAGCPIDVEAWEGMRYRK